MRTRKRLSAGRCWLVCAIAGAQICAYGTVIPNAWGEVSVPIEAGAALASPAVTVTPLDGTRRILIEEAIAGPANKPDETRPEPGSPWNPDLWSRLRDGFAMPDLDTPAVREFERVFAGKRYLERNAARARLYLYYVAGEVQKRGMPTEIALLPFVESAFNPKATSPVGACGMFQIMNATGRDLGLKNSVFVAQCRDVAESTRAALDYLQTLYAQFGDWHLALAAYNWGSGRVARAIERNRVAGKPADFANLRMPNETRAYVPQLQALKNIVRDPQRYGASLPAVENTPYFVEVTIGRDIDADLAAKLAGMSLSDFRVLNPSFNRPTITAAGHPRILLPVEAGVNFLAAMGESAQPLSSWTSHTLTRRETVKSLAARLGVDAGVVSGANSIPAGMRVKAGSTVVVPRPQGSDGNISHATVSDAHLAFEPDLPDFKKVKVVVRKGDTPATIAARLRTAKTKLLEWNPGLAGKKLHAGGAVELNLPYSLATTIEARRDKPSRAVAKATPHGGKPARGKRLRAQARNKAPVRG